MQVKRGSTFKAALIIAATCMGVSYFTLPILTGIAGFLPALFITLFFWGFTLATGLLYAEATLSQPDGANLLSISRALLGKTWMVFFAIVFSVNMLGYLSAYTFFIEQCLQWFFKTLFHIQIPSLAVSLLSTLPLFFILFLGLAFSLNINAVLMIGFVFSFFLTIFWGSAFVDQNYLLKKEWSYLYLAVPTLLASFGFISIIPSLCTYLNRDPKKIRSSIWIGTLITLVAYFFWQWLMIGSVSDTTFWVNFEEGVELSKVFTLAQRFPRVHTVLNFTLFFSMITSLLGHGIATVDFVSDGFKLPVEQRKGWKRLAVCLALFLLIFFVSVIKGHLVLRLLQRFTTPFGAVLINAIIPVWLVAQTRYVHSISAPVMLKGGPISLIVLGVIIFILIYLEGIVFIRS